ncbi:MAG: hypothetical protein WC519_00210 [Parcubacteria group bacterium]
MTEFRKKVLIQFGIAAMLFTAISGLMVYVWSDFESVGGSIETTMNAVATRTQAIGSLSTLREDAGKAEEATNRLRNALPRRDSLFLFSEEVNRLARERGLTPSFTFGTEVIGTSANSPSKIEFVMNIAGEYESVLAFMNSFEASRYFTHIKNFELLSQGVNTTAYQAILSGEVFFSK